MLGLLVCAGMIRVVHQLVTGGTIVCGPSDGKPLSPKRNSVDMVSKGKNESGPRDVVSQLANVDSSQLMRVHRLGMSEHMLKVDDLSETAQMVIHGTDTVQQSMLTHIITSTPRRYAVDAAGVRAQMHADFFVASMASDVGPTVMKLLRQSIIELARVLPSTTYLCVDKPGGGVDVFLGLNSEKISPRVVPGRDSFRGTKVASISDDGDLQFFYGRDADVTAAVNDVLDRLIHLFSDRSNLSDAPLGLVDTMALFPGMEQSQMQKLFAAVIERNQSNPSEKRGMVLLCRDDIDRETAQCIANFANTQHIPIILRGRSDNLTAFSDLFDGSYVLVKDRRMGCGLQWDQALLSTIVSLPIADIRRIVVETDLTGAERLDNSHLLHIDGSAHIHFVVSHPDQDSKVMQLEWQFFLETHTHRAVGEPPLELHLLGVGDGNLPLHIDINDMITPFIQFLDKDGAVFPAIESDAPIEWAEWCRLDPLSQLDQLKSHFGRDVMLAFFNSLGGFFELASDAANRGHVVHVKTPYADRNGEADGHYLPHQMIQKVISISRHEPDAELWKS